MAIHEFFVIESNHLGQINRVRPMNHMFEYLTQIEFASYEVDGKQVFIFAADKGMFLNDIHDKALRIAGK